MLSFLSLLFVCPLNGASSSAPLNGSPQGALFVQLFAWSGGVSQEPYYLSFNKKTGMFKFVDTSNTSPVTRTVFFGAEPYMWQAHKRSVIFATYGAVTNKDGKTEGYCFVRHFNPYQTPCRWTGWTSPVPCNWNGQILVDPVNNQVAYGIESVNGTQCAGPVVVIGKNREKKCMHGLIKE